MSNKQDYKLIYTTIMSSYKKDEQIDKLEELIEQKKITSNDQKQFIQSYILYLNGNFDKSKDILHEILLNDTNNEYILNAIGRLHSCIKDYNIAKTYLEKSIKINPSFSSSYNNLANIYLHSNNNEKAIELYKTAIKINDTSIHPRQNLGQAYINTGEYKNAIESFENVLKIDPNYHESINGIGRVMMKLQKYDDAKYYLKKASDLDTENTFYIICLMELYKEIQDYITAKDYCIRALEIYEDKKYKYFISEMKKQLIDLDDKIESFNILNEPVDDETEDKIVKSVLKEITDSGIGQKVTSNRNKSLKFLEENFNNSTKNSYLKVLRRWNSYTPIVADNYHTSKGGGYFIRKSNLGIVVDPGFNFIDNFRGEGHTFSEITTIFISHAHNDHTTDLESILTLLFKYNENVKENIKNELGKTLDLPLDKVPNHSVHETFQTRRKVLDIYITKSTFAKFMGLFNLCSNNDYEIHIIEKEKTYKLGKDISMYIIDAKHFDILSDRDSVGFLLLLPDSALIYTGDTGWSKHIEKQYKKVSKKCSQKNTILIAHIGGFKDHENNYILPEYEDKKDKQLYKNHLGRIGLIRINEVIKPDLCLISEFGEEFKGFRIELTDIYQRSFENNIKFLPADIGLYYNFDDNKIRAITKIDYDSGSLKSDFVDIKNVNTCLLRKDYSLHYFSTYHKLIESDVIQFIREDFDKKQG